MQNIIKQIREARAKADKERWYSGNETGHDVQFILSCFDNIDTILDRLEEAERKAKAGEELAEALSGSPYRDGKTYSIEGTDSYWEEWRDRLLYIYNKTVK